MNTKTLLWSIMATPVLAGYHASSFDPREATISSTHHSLYTGLTTCREVVSAFLSRIETLNNHTNAVLALNPHALATADAMDARLQANNASGFGPLFCIPSLLKDNWDTADMPTTGSSLSLNESQPSHDAAGTKALRDAGAVVIGKANLHELALEGLTVSSLGGQTINPYDTSRTPGGSSGGTGAAVAASFAVWGTGTDTVNSLRSPASANSLFSCRPTRGLISRRGVIPVSYTQDTIGPIARCVDDVAAVLTVLAGIGYDEGDNATALVPAGSRKVDYTVGLDQGSLKGVRFGLVEGFFNRMNSSETTPVNEAMANMTAKLQDAGATIVPITEGLYNSSRIGAELDTQRYEFRQELNAYLQRPSLSGPHPSTLEELTARPPGDFLVIPSQYEYVNTALVSSTGNESWEGKPSYDTVQNGIQNLTLALAETFASNHLDALIYPEQQNLVVPIGSPSQSGRNGILAALTGSPVVTVPAGFSKATKTAPDGVPIGMEILGRPWTEGQLLKIAKEIEGLGRVRKTPRWAKEAVEAKEYESVPEVTPDRGYIPEEYPLGTL